MDSIEFKRLAGQRIDEITPQGRTGRDRPWPAGRLAFESAR